MGMGFAPTWLRRVSPLLHKTTLTNARITTVSAVYGEILTMHILRTFAENDCWENTQGYRGFTVDLIWFSDDRRITVQLAEWPALRFV